jgi:glycosyltransferase involved in cell wall biosynthesis
MRIALVSPLPPARTGVAEFAARLGRELRAVADVDLLEAAQAAALAVYEKRLYQIGNNHLHAGAYEAALAVPGVVELHDAVLHHFLLGRLAREEYLDEFVHNCGEWTRDLASELWQRRAQSAADEAYFRYPMLRRIVEASEAVIVHNPGAARRAREAAAHPPPIVEIPHYVETQPPAARDEIAATRASLHVPADALLIGCFGFQRPTRRLRSVLRAVARLAPPWRLLVAGEFVSSEYEASLAELLAQPGVMRLPHASEDELRRLTSAVDVCVNLRWPSAGETSGIAMRLMAAGKPVIVTGAEEWAAVPEGAVLRIDAGEPEGDELVEVLELLAREPEMRLAAGAAARRHVEEHHGIDAVLKAYCRALGLDGPPA